MNHRSTFSAHLSAGTTSGLDRRGFLTAVGGGLAALAVAGCTNSALDDPAAGSATTSPGSEPAADAFPVTVTHRFGDTTIPASRSGSWPSARPTATR